MSSKATRVRYGGLAFTCVLSMITYLDRVCFGVAAPILADELSLSSVADLKWVFAAFAIAYAAFEIPTGWLVDVWGPRGTLIRIVIWWSICTTLTGIKGRQYRQQARGWQKKFERSQVLTIKLCSRFASDRA